MSSVGRIDRLAAWGLLASLAVGLVGSGLPLLDWGIGRTNSWAYDEIQPRHVVAETSEDRWPLRYPPLHRHLLRLVRGLAERGGVDPTADAPEGLRAQWRATRAPSLALTVGTLWLLYRAARLVARPLPAALAPAAYAGAMQTQYYSRTANLEAHYLFWVAAALWMFQRARRRASLADAAAFGACGTLASLAKDQALPLFVLPGLYLVWERRGAWPAAAERGTLRTGAGRWRLVAATITVGLGLVAAAYGLPAGWETLRAHVAEITGPASEPFRRFDSSWNGEWALLRWAGQHLLLVTPPAVATAIGLGGVVALADATRRRRVLPLLLFPLSYYLGFIAPIGYHYDRFFLPVAMVGALLLPGLAEAAPRRVRPTLASAAILSVVATVELPRAVELYRRTRNDSRIAVGRFLGVPAVAARGALVLGNPWMLPHHSGPVQGEDPRLEPDCQRLSAFDWIVINRHEFTGSGRWKPAFRKRLLRGELGFERFASFDLRDDALLRFDGVYSNLEQVDPALEIYGRRSTICAASAVEWHRQAVASGSAAERARFVADLSGEPWRAARLRDDPHGVVVAVGLTANGWTRGTEPAILVVQSHAGEWPTVAVAHRAPAEFFPVEIELTDEAGRATRWTLTTPGRRDLALPRPEAGESAVFELRALRAWRPSAAAGRAGNRTLGVQLLRIGAAPGGE